MHASVGSVGAAANSACYPSADEQGNQPADKHPDGGANSQSLGGIRFLLRIHGAGADAQPEQGQRYVNCKERDYTGEDRAPRDAADEIQTVGSYGCNVG